MNNGTNNYDAFKTSPTEEIVSRTLQSNYRSYSNVIWRTGKPALDSEWNLINDMATELFVNSIRSNTPSGWVELGKNKYSTNSGIANSIVFYAQENELEATVPNAFVNGWPILVGGVNYSDSSANKIVLQSAGVTARYDFVFLEVWRAQVRSRDADNVPIAQNKPGVAYIYKFGNVQYGGTNLPDDLIDPVFDEETSERVQIQYRIRVVSNVPFTNTEVVGFESSLVQGQGAGSIPQTTGYTFTNMYSELGDVGLWRTGNGNEASQVALQSVDGYSYAIPMFKIYRRAFTAYSDTGGDLSTALYNQTGNISVLSVGVSDRPDTKFIDGIDATDIIDLRNKISLSGWNYQKIIEQNIDKLLNGTLRSNYMQSIAYDLVADTDVFGYNDILSNQGASGKRIYWSDAITDQTNIFAEVKTTTTSTVLDVYRSSGTGVWKAGNTIVVKKTTKLPAGTKIKFTPRVHLEDKSKTQITGSWAGLNSETATFTLDPGVWVDTNYDIWVYYDIELPANQGLTYVPDELLKVTYTNASLFSNGVIVRDTILKSKENRFQDLLEHPFENKSRVDGIITETSITHQRKQIKISPLVQTTTIKNGSTRTLEVETLDKTNMTVYVPYPLQHLRGVYTAVSGGTEIAMQNVTIAVQVSSLDVDNNKFLISSNDYIGNLTSLQYIPSGPGSEIELLGLTYEGALLSYVLEHVDLATGTIGSRVSLYNTNGVIWPIPSGATASQFKWTGKKIEARLLFGYGYDIGGLIIDCSGSTNHGLIASMSDRQKVWIDCDYLAPPHNGAQLRMIYSYTPYQGSSIGGQELSMIYKRDRGFFFNNGTGGGTISITGSTGTSNYYYTPVSPRLPGSFEDHLRDGTPIEISSSGTKRYSSDFWSNVSYDIYGYRGGCKIWADDYAMPSTPEITQRGFVGYPMLEVIFEEPIQDATYAEFVMPILVRNKATGQLYLMVQVGNKGVHTSDSSILVDLFHLDERIITK